MEIGTPDPAARDEVKGHPLPAFLPILDLTAQFCNNPSAGELVECAPASVMDSVIRGLHRGTSRHVLVTGVSGVGKTSFLHNLASVACGGRFPFLNEKRFVWINCRYVSREDSRACLESLLHFGMQQPNLVLCLDDLAALLRRPGGDDNKALLKAALAQNRVHIVATLTKWDFNDLISTDAELLDWFMRVEIEEPRGEQLLLIVQAIARKLESEFRTHIPNNVVQRVLNLCSSYILNDWFPAKAAKILRKLCEDVDFDKTQRMNDLAEVIEDNVFQIVSDLTGVSRSTLGGHPEQPDFESEISGTVFGQSDAVHVAAEELQLIRGGFVDSNKPASVLLFAGMTGVGKTELAKQIAKLYSSSGRLLTYPMGNFTEPHSVSGIVGVPPGYVGHEQGGRLINDLISDPYSVFLLDEAEKAHPNIWVPFLNLFDEGWIVDQRGRKAYADRAIFILTTNAGAESILQMTQSQQSFSEVEQRVRQLLSKVRHERSSQPVFPAQFLARIKRTVVFRPLDDTAMLQISRLQVANLKENWRLRREKRVEVAEEVILAIAHRAHALNQKSGGREGGRIIRKLLSEHVDARIQSAAHHAPECYRNSTVVYVEFNSQNDSVSSMNPAIDIAVHFQSQCAQVDSEPRAASISIEQQVTAPVICAQTVPTCDLGSATELK